METELTSDSESLYRASRLYWSGHWHVGPVRGAFLDRNCLVSEHRTMIALRYEDNSPHVGRRARAGRHFRPKKGRSHNKDTMASAPTLGLFRFALPGIVGGVMQLLRLSASERDIILRLSLIHIVELLPQKLLAVENSRPSTCGPSISLYVRLRRLPISNGPRSLSGVRISPHVG